MVTRGSRERCRVSDVCGPVLESSECDLRALFLSGLHGYVYRERVPCVRVSAIVITDFGIVIIRFGIVITRFGSVITTAPR